MGENNTKTLNTRPDWCPLRGEPLELVESRIHGVPVDMMVIDDMATFEARPPGPSRWDILMGDD